MRAIPNLCDLSNELWKLTRNESKWEWLDTHQQQLESIKKALITDALGYFDKNWTTFLEVDASPVGAAAVLRQENPNNPQERRVIAYWSKMFSKSERNYSQCEREALAAVLGCEKFELYLLGRDFNLVTDNRAVQLIFNNPNSNPPAVIRRWHLRLSGFRVNTIHKPGKSNIADYMSRNPVEDASTSKYAEMADQFVHLIETTVKPSAITVEELVEATKDDEELQQVMAMVRSNRVEKEPKFEAYKRVESELSVTGSGLMLRGCRVVIPRSLRERECCIWRTRVIRVW